MIIWIASYPKSGNTWVRSFLSNYFCDDKKFDFTQLRKISKFPQEKVLKELNINFKDFKEIASNWISMQDYINLKNEIIYLKTHNALITVNNFEFTDTKNTLGFIYLVRDPRDVVLSYASHLGISVENTFEVMRNDMGFSVSKKNEEYKEAILGSWALNYNSWKNFKSVNGLIIRYEDLVNNPEKSFTKIVNYLNKISNLKVDLDKIKRCINNTEFNTLKNLENLTGFDEKGKSSFFRNGKIGEWKKNLDHKIVKEIEKIFSKEMRELDYI